MKQTPPPPHLSPLLHTSLTITEDLYTFVYLVSLNSWRSQSGVGVGGGSTKRWSAAAQMVNKHL